MIEYIFRFKFPTKSTNADIENASLIKSRLYLHISIFFNFRIASGSWDTTIKISEITTGNLLATLTGHTGVVYSLVHLENEQIASGSIDGTIKIWHLNSKNTYNLKMF